MGHDETMLQRLGELDACAVSDALDSLGLRGAVIGLRKVWDCGKIVGRAITVKLVPKRDGQASARHLGTAAIEIASPNDVIVVDNQGRPDVGAWGGILSVAAKAKGIRGAIVHGACRDADESREYGFPVFARSTVTVTARSRIVEHSYNEQIEIESVAIRPGDYVIADGSGVVFIAAERMEEVIAVAEKLANKERKMIDDLMNGTTVTEVMGKNYETMLERG